MLGETPRIQWRDRSGFAPDSLLPFAVAKAPDSVCMQFVCVNPCYLPVGGRRIALCNMNLLNYNTNEVTLSIKILIRMQDSACDSFGVIQSRFFHKINPSDMYWL
ncbi:hypothetical protein PN4B1_30990 [Paenibacillus naphthalenovorans]|nr:hypothetical protein PN4B1_30990 [Paenibacillus naphthalenovorans]